MRSANSHSISPQTAPEHQGIALSAWSRLALLLLVVTSVPPAADPAPPAPTRLFITSHPAMGTDFKLYLYSAHPTQAAAISAEVFDEIDRIEQLLSNYRDSSELSRINREAASQPVTTDPEMMSFLEQSLRWSHVSDGAFDITVGRLMRAWGFYRHSGRIPPPDELEALRSATGWTKLQLDLPARTVHFTAPGVELDPGGIGKGFAVDAAVRVLRADHVQAAMLSAGSSTIYALGAPPHQTGWRVVIPGPLPSKNELSVIRLRDTSLSSADCSVKNFTVDGHLYCHIMDLHTMRPVEGRIQVSIVNPSATASDALSNVLFVETPAEAAATLARYAPESQALIVSTNPTPAASPQQPLCTAFHWPSSIDPTHCAITKP